MSCELCETVFERDLGDFYILTCRTCKVPMIVLKEHRTILTKEEEIEVENIRKSLFPDKVFRDIGMRSQPDHWHEHLI